MVRFFLTKPHTRQMACKPNVMIYKVFGTGIDATATQCRATENLISYQQNNRGTYQNGC